jgi:polyphosphate kinase
MARQAVSAIDLTLADNVRARALRPEGTYVRLSPAAGEAAIDSQAAFLEDARQRTLRAVEQLQRGGAEPAETSEPAG